MKEKGMTKEEENHISEILKWVDGIISQANLRKGESKVVKCPKCGGDVKVSRSSYNGHYCACCDNCKMSFRQ